MSRIEIAARAIVVVYQIYCLRILIRWAWEKEE